MDPTKTTWTKCTKWWTAKVKTSLLQLSRASSKILSYNINNLSNLQMYRVHREDKLLVAPWWPNIKSNSFKIIKVKVVEHQTHSSFPQLEEPTCSEAKKIKIEISFNCNNFKTHRQIHFLAIQKFLISTKWLKFNKRVKDLSRVPVWTVKENLWARVLPRKAISAICCIIRI